MSRTAKLLTVLVFALALLLAYAVRTPAQQAGTYYLLIDGTTNPPRVVSSTLQPPPTVKELSDPGIYEITFRSNYRFLVGTAHSTIEYGVEWGADDLLFAHHSQHDPKVWHVITRRLQTYSYNGSGSDRFADWQYVDSVISLIVRS